MTIEICLKLEMPTLLATVLGRNVHKKIDLQAVSLLSKCTLVPMFDFVWTHGASLVRWKLSHFRVLLEVAAGKEIWPLPYLLGVTNDSNKGSVTFSVARWF